VGARVGAVARAVAAVTSHPGAGWPAAQVSQSAGPDCGTLHLAVRIAAGAGEDVRTAQLRAQRYDRTAAARLGPFLPALEAGSENAGPDCTHRTGAAAMRGSVPGGPALPMERAPTHGTVAARRPAGRATPAVSVLALAPGRLDARARCKTAARHVPTFEPVVRCPVPADVTCRSQIAGVQPEHPGPLPRAGAHPRECPPCCRLPAGMMQPSPPAHARPRAPVEHVHWMARLRRALDGSSGRRAAKP
jgi:hypothetical protein